MMGFLLFALMATTSPSVLTIPITPYVEPPKEWTQEEVKQYAIDVATEYGLHKQRFLAPLSCENGFTAKGQSNHYYKGVRERSFGSVQINLPSHPGITQEMAEDPYFAVRFMAQKWVEGDASLWSCWRGLVAVGG